MWATAGNDKEQAVAGAALAGGKRKGSLQAVLLRAKLEQLNALQSTGYKHSWHDKLYDLLTHLRIYISANNGSTIIIHGGIFLTNRCPLRNFSNPEMLIRNQITNPKS